MFDLCGSLSFSGNILTLGYSSCCAISGGRGSETTLRGSRIGGYTTGHINLTVYDQQQVLTTLAVYPNPTMGILHLNTNQYKNVDFTIFDILGNKLREGQSSDGISLQSLSNGLYLLKLSSPDATQTFRVLRN